jgi:hypothetical protein
MWSTKMVLIAPELGNDEGINVKVYHFHLFGLKICIEDKSNPLWMERTDDRSARHRKWEKEHNKNSVNNIGNVL